MPSVLSRPEWSIQWSTTTLLSLILYPFLFDINSSKSCQFTSTAHNASFDLKPLIISSGGQSKYYTVKDSRVSDEDSTKLVNFTYQFNICNEVLAYPSFTCQNLSESKNSGYCKPENIIDDPDNESNLICDTITQIKNKAFAYQTRKDTSESVSTCYHLGSDDSGDFKFTLLDYDDPSSGVVLTYENGDWCGKYNKNRKFNIRFECENDQFNIPDEEKVEEEECEYNITVKSIYGCPSECGIYSYQLCANNGICEYDWSNTKARCFCYHGYSGTSCEHYADDILDPESKDPPVDDTYTHTFKITDFYTTDDEKIKTRNVSVLYDLSPFRLDNEVYQVIDKDNSGFKYYFNILENVDENLLPNSCVNATGPCTEDDTSNCDMDDIDIVGKTGSAFQYNNQTGKCNLVGTANDENDYEWSLYDEGDAAKGVVLTYINGGYCSNFNQNRKFEIELECPDSTRDYYKPDEELLKLHEFVDEGDDCEYTIYVETALACPYECITDAIDNETNTIIPDQFQVCSGRGVCAADSSAGEVRCLCDSGWTGYACNEKEKSSVKTIDDNNTGFQVAIAVISIVLIAVIGLVVYYRMRLNSLQKNLQRQLLEDEEDDDIDNIRNENNIVGGMMNANNNNDDSDDDDDDDDSGDDAGIGDNTNPTDGNELVSVRTDVGTKGNDLIVEDIDEDEE